MPELKSLDDLIILNALSAEDSPGKFTNKVMRVRKKPRSGFNSSHHKWFSIWYLKPRDTEKNAIRETVVQELMRLVLPRQPKTRVVRNEKGKYNHLKSKEVGDGEFSSLQKEYIQSLNEKFNNGFYKGLGEIMVMALFINERDLKLGNLFVDKYNRIIKIDGDHCLRLDDEHDISSADIDLLPFVKDFYCNNWFDVIQYNSKTESSQANSKSDFFNLALNYNPEFRNEVNRTLMKVISLPEDLLRDFIKEYLPPGMTFPGLYKEILIRQKKLKNAALDSRSFRKYMLSEQAGSQAYEFLRELQQFHMRGKVTLDMNVYNETMLENLTELSETIAQEDERSAKTLAGIDFFNVYNQLQEQEIKQQMEAQSRPSLWQKFRGFFYWPGQEKASEPYFSCCHKR